MRFNRLGLWVHGALIALAIHGVALAKAPVSPWQSVRTVSRVMLHDEEVSVTPPPKVMGLVDLERAVGATSGIRIADDQVKMMYKTGDRSTLSDNPAIASGVFEANLPDRGPAPKVPEDITDLGGGKFSIIHSSN